MFIYLFYFRGLCGEHLAGKIDIYSIYSIYSIYKILKLLRKNKIKQIDIYFIYFILEACVEKIWLRKYVFILFIKFWSFWENK